MRSQLHVRDMHATHTVSRHVLAATCVHATFIYMRSQRLGRNVCVTRTRSRHARVAATCVSATGSAAACARIDMCACACRATICDTHTCARHVLAVMCVCACSTQQHVMLSQRRAPHVRDKRSQCSTRLLQQCSVCMNAPEPSSHATYGGTSTCARQALAVQHATAAAVQRVHECSRAQQSCDVRGDFCLPRAIVGQAHARWQRAYDCSTATVQCAIAAEKRALTSVSVDNDNCAQHDCCRAVRDRQCAAVMRDSHAGHGGALLSLVCCASATVQYAATVMRRATAASSDCCRAARNCRLPRGRCSATAVRPTHVELRAPKSHAPLCATTRYCAPLCAPEGHAPLCATTRH